MNQQGREFINYIDTVIRQRNDMRTSTDWWIANKGKGFALIVAQKTEFFRELMKRLVQDDAIAYLCSENGKPLRDLFEYLGGFVEQGPQKLPLLMAGQQYGQPQQAGGLIPCPACGTGIPPYIKMCPSCLTELRWK